MSIDAAHDPTEQVGVLRWLAWNDCPWAPAVAPFYFEHIVKTTFGIGKPDVASFPAHIPTLQRYAIVLDGPSRWARRRCSPGSARGGCCKQATPHLVRSASAEFTLTTPSSAVACMPGAM